jgi:hypothetical protein
MSQKHGSATKPPEGDFGSKDDLTQAKGKCPLCFEYEVASSTQYQSHVGHHLEQLALFVLPRAEEDEQQTTEEAADLGHENEMRLMLEKLRLEAEEAKNEAEAAKKERDELLKKIEAESRIKLAEEANKGSLDVEEAKKKEEAAKEREELLRRLEAEIRTKVIEEAKEPIDAEEAKKNEEIARKERIELLKKIEAETRIKIAEEERKAGGDEKEPIQFKDALGRKFNIPWNLCAAWPVRIQPPPPGFSSFDSCLINSVAQDMEDIIKQAFTHVAVIGPHVQEGHYDLIGPDDEIILPVVWEKAVQPGWNISMRMWPSEKHLLKGQWPAMPDISPRPMKQFRKARKTFGSFAGAKPPRLKKSHPKTSSSSAKDGSPHADQAELKKPATEEEAQAKAE